MRSPSFLDRLKSINFWALFSDRKPDRPSASFSDSYGEQKKTVFNFNSSGHSR